MKFRLNIRENPSWEPIYHHDFATREDALAAEAMIISALDRKANYSAATYTQVLPVAPTLNGHEFSEAEVQLLRSISNTDPERRNIVPAIKYARAVSGAGLKEAKDWVDALRAR